MGAPYAQAQQVDGTGRRNVLLSRQQALVQRSTVPAPRTDAFGEGVLSCYRGASAFAGDGLRTERASRMMAVELLPQDIEPQDPLGADLGGKRILRTLPLTAGAGNLLRRCRVTIRSRRRHDSDFNFFGLQQCRRDLLSGVFYNWR